MSVVDFGTWPIANALENEASTLLVLLALGASAYMGRGRVTAHTTRVVIHFIHMTYLAYIYALIVQMPGRRFLTLPRADVE
jgi:hypothetical protein